VVAGNSAAGALHLPQPIEPQLGETLLADDQPTWYEFRVWLDKGYAPRFTFPNGMISVRNTYARLFRTYSKLFPEEVRGDYKIVPARIAALRYGQIPQVRVHEVEIRGPLAEPGTRTPAQVIVGDAGFAPERTREILENFAHRAYRRPVRTEEIDRLM